MLWAGSVEIINTLSLVFASWRATLQLNIKMQVRYRNVHYYTDACRLIVNDSWSIKNLRWAHSWKRQTHGIPSSWDWKKKMKIVFQKTFLDFKIADQTKNCRLPVKFKLIRWFHFYRFYILITYLHVVFPTPPFPPTKIQRNAFWSMIFWIVGSKGSNSSLASAAAILNVSKWLRDTKY